MPAWVVFFLLKHLIFDISKQHNTNNQSLSGLLWVINQMTMSRTRCSLDTGFVTFFGRLGTLLNWYVLLICMTRMLKSAYREVPVLLLGSWCCCVCWITSPYQSKSFSRHQITRALMWADRLVTVSVFWMKRCSDTPTADFRWAEFTL